MVLELFEMKLRAGHPLYVHEYFSPRPIRADDLAFKFSCLPQVSKLKGIFTVSKIIINYVRSKQVNNQKTRDSTDAALDRGRAASVLMPAKPVVAV